MKFRPVKNPIPKTVLLICGFISVFLGILGIPLPVLPTTPFLILAAICFSYSSERFYKKIIDNKHFGKNVRNYLDGKGIPLKAKLTAVPLLWISLGISLYLIRKDIWLQVLLVLVGIFVTWFILREPNSEDFEG